MIAARIILADRNHPIYKRLILLNGFVFSKSDLAHALQQYSLIRDYAIDKLCDEGIFSKEPIFAKTNSNGIVEHLEGFIKCSPTNNNDSIEDNIRFANMLATYNITLEDYIAYFITSKLLCKTQLAI